MKGWIYPSSPGACACGGKFKTFNCKVTKISYPLCDGCHSTPPKMLVRKNMPDKDGKVYKQDFRENSKGEALTDVCLCIELIGELNKDIYSPEFRIEKYSAKHKKALIFSNVAEKYVDMADKRAKLPQEHDEYLAPKSHKERKRYVENHLKPFFKDDLIDQIDKHRINSFFLSYTSKFRTRNLAVGELKTLMYFAMEELEVIKHVPQFPVLKKAKQVRANQIPSVQIQAQIIRSIESLKYREFWTTVAVLAKREGEGRAWKVKNYTKRFVPIDGGLHEERSILVTDSHFSYGEKGDTLISGRKSIKVGEELGTVEDVLDDFLIAIIEKNIAGKGPEEFIFSGDKGDHMISSTATKHWNKACKKLKIKVSPYIGTKHATLSELLRKTGSLAKVIKFSNHTNEDTAKAYAKLNSEDTKDFVDTERFRGCV